MKAWTTLGCLVAVLGVPAAAYAKDLHVVAPAGGGLDALDVSVDAAAGVVRVRAGDKGSKDIAIPIERSRIDVDASRVEIVPVGEGRFVVTVRVPDFQRKDLAFEAVLSAQGDVPIFAGLTGYTSGDDGDRAGNVVLTYDRDEKSKFVIVAETREDTRICGQATTPLGPRGVDPKTMQLHGATLHRIDKKARDSAEPVVAEVRKSTHAPLARVLVATGGSAPKAAALTDGDPTTTWSEQRPGDGHGEFATLRAPAEVPLRSLVVTIAPPNAPKGDAHAAPRTFFVATDDHLFHVTMPEDAWQKPGQTYDVPFPKPVKTTCVAVVLDEAYVQGKSAPEVAIAEIAATSQFDADGATLDDLVKALMGPRSDEAVALLRRAGDPGLAAVLAGYAALDAKGHALAIDVASSTGTCEGASAELLTRALTDRDVEVKRRALGRLERCGRSAGDALAAAVRSDDEARRAAAAPLLATVAPSLAIEPLVSQMGKGKPDTRHAIRAAFARVAGASTRDKLVGLLGRKDVTPIARLDLLRALGAKLPELRPESDAAIADLLRISPDMPTRYLLVQPLAALARAPDATPGELSRLAEIARRDPEWAVRARAVELSAGIGPLVATVVAATADPEPRVREAALHAIATAGAQSGADAASQLLAKDEWTFARVAAADALGAIPENRNATEALAKALGDASSKVRFAAVGALGKQRATNHANDVRERLDDKKEDADVRALAAKTLGALCDRGATDRLTTLAQLSRHPADATDDRVGMAAIEALGTLHPADLEKRLAPLRDKAAPPMVRRAADRAFTEPGACR